MNSPRSRVDRDSRDGLLRSRRATLRHLFAESRLDPDLPLEAVSPILAHVGASALSVIAWIRHEDVRTLVHHPLEVAAAVAWSGGFFLLSLGVRMFARSLRKRHAIDPWNSSTID